MAVGDDKGTALFYELDKIGIVFFGAGQNDFAAVSKFIVRFSGLKILRNITELVNDQILRTYLRDKLKSTISIFQCFFSQ